MLAAVVMFQFTVHAAHVAESYGTPEASLKDIFRATVMAKILYCDPAWSGFCSTALMRSYEDARDPVTVN